jgi:DNA repair protein RadC
MNKDLNKTYLVSDYVSHLKLQESYKVYRVKDIPKSERPHEKLQSYGPEELSNRELLASILYTGTKKEGVMTMASRVIDEYGDNYVINETDPKRLAKFLNLPISKATQIVATFSLGKRLFSQKKKRSVTIRNSKEAFKYLKDMSELPKEHLRGLYLNSRYKLIHEETISIGTLTESLVHPREVFRPAIEYGAVAVILAHNHPSGDLSASDADIELTERITQAGKILGIELIDHIIITNGKHSSVSIHK